MSRIAEIMREARVPYTVAKAQAEAEAALPPVLPYTVARVVVDIEAVAEAYLDKYGCPSCWGDCHDCTCATDKAAIRSFVEHLKAATPPRAHAPDCAIAVNGRHACSCAAIGGSDMEAK